MSEAAELSAGQQRVRQAIASNWQQAQDYWSRFLLLNEPVLSDDTHSIAQIHLGTRQVTLNEKQIIEGDLFDCVEGLLAHEVGHHVRYPGTLAVEARMRMLERSIVPLDAYSFTNQFQDLMINEYLGRDLRDQFIRVYQAFTGAPAFHTDNAWKRDPAFMFYVSLYEILWDLPAGTLMGQHHREFAEKFPGYRAEATLLVHELFRMEPNILYAVSLFSFGDDTISQTHDRRSPRAVVCLSNAQRTAPHLAIGPTR